MPATKESKSKATAAASWKRAQPEEIKLPSGNTAALIRPNMYVLIKTGQVPDEMMRMLEGDDTLDFKEKQSAIEWQVSVAFAEPKVVLGEAQDGELSIDDVEDRDKSAVLEFIGGLI
jgi:hypothetical protein